MKYGLLAHRKAAPSISGLTVDRGAVQRFGVLTHREHFKNPVGSTITAIVDHTKQLRETDERNNEMVRKFDLR
jgi:hypothetical protein